MTKPLYIVYAASTNPIPANKLRQTIANALNEGFDELYILISSGGGNVYEGLATAAMIKALQIPVITHNIGQVDSVANVLFAAGKTRYANQNATFMFHGVSLNFEKASFIEPQLKEQYDGLRGLRDKIAQNYSTYTNIPIADVTALMIDGGQILSASDAVKKKMVAEIKEPVIPKGVKVISISDV